MSDENKKEDFDEKLFWSYTDDYCGKRDKIEGEMLAAWSEYTRKIEDAQKRLYDLKKTDGEKYDGTPYGDDVKNHTPDYKVLTGDGLMPVEGAEKITKAVDEAFPKIFDEVSRRLGSGSDMAMASAANIAHYAMSLPIVKGFSWGTISSGYYRDYCNDKTMGYVTPFDHFGEIIKYAKENRFAAIRASYNLALTCETPDPTFVEDCERQLERLDDESLDEVSTNDNVNISIFDSPVDGKTVVVKRERAKAGAAVLDFIAEWRLREHFTEWVRDGRPDKLRGSEKGDKGGK